MPTKKKKKINLATLAKRISQAQKILLTTHLSPDGDGIGSLLGLAHALKKAGKKVETYLADPVPQNLRFLSGSEKISKTLPKQKMDLSLILDAGDIFRVGDNFVNWQNRGLTICLDHHFHGEQNVDLICCDERAASTGELTHALIKKLHFKISASAATALLTAISTDTGSFRYGNTTPQTLRLAAELLEQGADLVTLSRQCFELMSQEKFLLYRLALERMRKECKGKLAWFWLDAQDFKNCGALSEDADGFINSARALSGVEVSVFFKQLSPSETKIAFRSTEWVDVGAIAAAFGGGGHVHASGFTFAGDWQSAQRKIFPVIRRVLTKK